MYVGTELLVVIVGLLLVPVVVMVILGVVGFESQIGDFSLLIEGMVRLIPPPDDFSEFFLGFRLYGGYQFLESGPFRLKLNIGNLNVTFNNSESELLKLEFQPSIGGTLEINQLRLRINLFKNGGFGGIYWKF
ncbi:hypothetical protein MNL76_08970 [Fervidobacterium riparium]|uniref:Uncharacterized protein n=1 Tax=Fervidobacterium gondwanense DSM 13020 TaxID=1121883 RepID=A0A1M7TBT4_FERGO|nr:hypothetical protein [Fervidobacterium gondwanense]UXF01768.1 hypothetical protein IB67_09650 [Fervidobacterium riparium]SHN68229.1 hypothetical protein SAMN02745226_01811 [Fervidobacterium gondwanense DSM 13020]